MLGLVVPGGVSLAPVKSFQPTLPLDLTGGLPPPPPYILLATGLLPPRYIAPAFAEMTTRSVAESPSPNHSLAMRP